MDSFSSSKTPAINTKAKMAAAIRAITPIAITISDAVRLFSILSCFMFHLFYPFDFCF